MSRELATRVEELREHVIDGGKPDEDAGHEIFDAILRVLSSADETSPGLDLTLHDALSRRLAWGESEAKVLSDADSACRRLIDQVHERFSDSEEEAAVLEAAITVAGATARILTLAALGRGARERAAQMREELAQNRLRQALERQVEELARLRAALGEE